MASARSWFLIGLLSVACVVPDVEVVDDSGDDDTPTPGSAVGKFCNDLTVDGENVPLTLTIGTATDQTVFTADSGTCRPISGKACAGIPVGTDLTVTLLAEDVEIVSYPVEVADGDAWIFLAYADGESVDLAADPVTDAVCRLGYDAPAAPPAQ